MDAHLIHEHVGLRSVEYPGEGHQFLAARHFLHKLVCAVPESRQTFLVRACTIMDLGHASIAAEQRRLLWSSHDACLVVQVRRPI